MRTITSFILLFFLAGPAFAADVGSIYQRSYDLEAKLDYPQALTVLDELPKAEKASYTHQLRRGWLLYLSGKYEESVAVYRETLRLEPKAIEPLLGISLPQMALRRWLDAEKTLERALQIDPNNYLARSRLAYTLFSLGRYGPAETAYRAVLRLYPSDVEMQTGLGYALLRQSKASEAEKIFSRVIEVTPRHPTAAAGLSASRR